MTNRSNRRYRGLPSVVVVTTALAASGCHVNNPNEPTPPSVATKALDELKSLPSLEDTKIAVQAAIDAIKVSVGQVVPTAVWRTSDDGTGDDCQRPYEQTPGKRYFLPDVVAENVAVTEAQWTQIEAATKTSAAKLGATDIQVMRNAQGSHDVGFYGPTGLFIKISYSGNIVIAGYTGCRLPAEAKRGQ